jgi:hypothetical protein
LLRATFAAERLRVRRGGNAPGRDALGRSHGADGHDPLRQRHLIRFLTQTTPWGRRGQGRRPVRRHCYRADR